MAKTDDGSVNDVVRNCEEYGESVLEDYPDDGVRPECRSRVLIDVFTVLIVSPPLDALALESAAADRRRTLGRWSTSSRYIDFIHTIK